MMEFHVSRWARDYYQFDRALFSTTGNVILADFQAARLFAQKMNAMRDLVDHPEKTVRAGQINAMGLIDEILHQVVYQYQQQCNPQAVKQALGLAGRASRPAGSGPDSAAIHQRVPAPGDLSGQRQPRGIPGRQLDPGERRARLEPRDRPGRAADALAGE